MFSVKPYERLTVATVYQNLRFICSDSRIRCIQKYVKALHLNCRLFSKYKTELYRKILIIKDKNAFDMCGWVNYNILDKTAQQTTS